MAVVIETLEDYLVIEDILEVGSLGDPFGNATAAEQIGSYEAIDRVARKKGITVVEAGLPGRFDGFACEVRRSDAKPHANVIVMSGQTGVERKRSNFARALGHCSMCATGNPQIRIGKAMDRFAGAFLVPAEHLANVAGSHRKGTIYGEIVRMKNLYGISAAEMLIRLEQAGILPQTVINYAFRSYARKWLTEEPEPLRDGEGFGSLEHPQRFEHLVWRALGEQLISPIRGA